MTENTKEIVILHESILHSIAKDAVSAFSLLSSVGVGVWIDSTALQWCAGIMWALWIIGKSFSYMKTNAFSFDDARKKIDQYEQEASRK